MLAASLLICAMMALVSADGEAVATGAPATDAPATDAPATNNTATDAPATNDTAIDAPATDAPATNDTAIDAPATNDTAIDAPATNNTASDAPATNDTATDAPATNDTATDAPATDSPATDAPATDAPVTDAPATDAPAPSCPDGWNEINGRCFSFVPKTRAWVDAEKHCQSMNANLASVHSTEEENFILGMIRAQTSANPEVWVGGSDCQECKVWLWTDGSMFTYTSWCSGEPNNLNGKQACLLMNHGGSTCWDDEDCSTSNASVCSKAMQ